MKQEIIVPLEIGNSVTIGDEITVTIKGKKVKFEVEGIKREDKDSCRLEITRCINDV